MKICLNMIVKNEAHIIEETLNSVKKYISYWVISDTGSTDNTKEIITSFFEKENIPGKLVEHEWKDFGTNRTLALEACYKHRKNFSYIWVFDADDLVVGDFKFPEKMEFDMYSIKYGNDFVYMRTQVFNSFEKWKYVGVLHEYPECSSKKNPTKGVITGDYYINSRRLGARSQVEDKYLRDAKILEQGLIDEPNNTRYMFYLGQSYMDAKEYEKAVQWYEKRANSGGWYEEVYYSLYRIALCTIFMGDPWKKSEEAFMRAWKYLPSRAEPLYEIGKHYRMKNQFQKGYNNLKIASTIPFPKNQVLFLFKNVYDYLIFDELSICAYYLEKYQESMELSKKIINVAPQEHLPRILKNLTFVENKIKKIEGSRKNKILVFFVGYASFEGNIYGAELALLNICKYLMKYYNVFVFGHNCNNSRINDVSFLHSKTFHDFISNNEIDVLIISRYIHYFIEFPICAKKTFIWLHDSCYHSAWNGIRLPEGGKYLVNNVMDRIYKIVALSSWHKEYIMSLYGIPERKLSIIGNALNDQLFQDYQNFEDIEKIPYRFIYTTDANRGLEQLLDYLEIIKEEYPLTELYMYRDETTFKDHKYLLDRINNTNYVHFCGRLDQSDLIKEFIKTDIWLYPTSTCETYCMSGLEALRSGCYCIASNLAGLKDSIGDRGVLIDGDPKNEETKEKFLNEVRKAFNDIEYKRSVQKRSFHLVKGETWEHVSKEWLKLIE